MSLSLLPLGLFKNKETKQTHKAHQLKEITHLNIKMTVTKNAQVIWDECNKEREDPAGKFKYHFKYWQLCPLPCLTPLIHLPLHLSRTVLCSLFQSMLLFLVFFPSDPASSVYWHMPSSLCIPTPPLPPTVLLLEWPRPDRCLYFCPWTLGLSCFRGQEQ